MSPMAAFSSVAKQAEQLRQDGNNYFKKDRFGAAIDAYTEAITLCPNIPVYWTNRALCHRKKNNWTRVEEDCRKAIQLDNSSVKAKELKMEYWSEAGIILEGTHSTFLELLIT
ncbi:hypothetical protein BVRB_005560 isoform B [Beta vulgaris subsp. vulgaris]|uniref:RING-type E3 ubiquitin transferase n=1 Tax=Beta vulgaris subsp. vulgaris TaxID=3555 RepID=A0A0J8B3Z0_BETVV|nr:hypothetical protein BVRB_005560 isoform B [Beta vulgaris subsp. vulgaris]